MGNNREYETYTLTNEAGDIVKVTEMEVKEGNAIKVTVTTEDQREGYKHKLELDEQMREFIKKNEGAFIHLIFKYGATIFKELEEKAPGSKCNTHIIRFMMLTTCLTFGGNLFDSSKNRVKKSSLKRIWDTSSRNSINETYDLLIECGYIYETEEGYLMINEDIVIKGAIENFKELKKQDRDFTCTRVFVDNLKAMYEGTEQKQRKQLANLFKILPYINYKHNVFCTNPTETDDSKLKLLTWTDLARICGYEEKKNIAKFKKDLWNLKIFGHCVIGEFHCKAGMSICVNPKVYYGGDDVDDVRSLYSMFKMCEKK